VRDIVNIVMNLRADKFQPGLATVTFSSRLMLRGIGVVRFFRGLLEVICCVV